MNQFLIVVNVREKAEEREILNYVDNNWEDFVDFNDSEDGFDEHGNYIGNLAPNLDAPKAVERPLADKAIQVDEESKMIGKIPNVSYFTLIDLFIYFLQDLKISLIGSTPSMLITSNMQRVRADRFVCLHIAELKRSCKKFQEFLDFVW